MALPDTLKRLRALADSDTAPEGKRAAARKTIERILANNPGLSLEDAAPEEASLDIPYKQWQEEYLIVYAASFLGLEVFELRHTRKVKRMRVEGDPRLITTLQDLLKEHRPKLEELLKYYMHGFLTRTFPQPPRERPDDAAPKLTPEQLQAAMAGMDAGRPASVSQLRLEERHARERLEAHHPTHNEPEERACSTRTTPR